MEDSQIRQRKRLQMPDEEEGIRLKTARESVLIDGDPLMQTEVADELLIPRSYYNDMEAGRKKITFYVLKYLYISYDISPLYIISGEGPIFVKELLAKAKSKDLSVVEDSEEKGVYLTKREYEKYQQFEQLKAIFKD